MSTHQALARAGDQELIKAFRDERSETAARVLIERFSPQLLRTVARVLGDHAGDAEDVLQEGWIRGLGGIAEYRGESAFATWMTRIAVRCALDHLRRRETRVPLYALNEARAIASPAVDCDLATDVERALTRLSANARAVLLMHDLEGFTHPEIADALGIAVGTSKAHLFNARRKLRRLLDGISGNEATA